MELRPESGSRIVETRFDCDDGCRLVLEDLVAEKVPWRHDPVALAAAAFVASATISARAAAAVVAAFQRLARVRRRLALDTAEADGTAGAGAAETAAKVRTAHLARTFG